MNKKSYSFDLDTFRNMLHMCPKLPGQKFVDPPFEEDILTFMRELGYSGNIKFLSDVKVETLPQPWRTFKTLINKCISGKVKGIDTLRLSRDQILWGLYHQQKIDYVYLLWEDLVFQIKKGVKEEKNTCFTLDSPKSSKAFKTCQIWLAIISDNNPVIILKASIPSKRKLDLSTGINFLGHGLLDDHAKACDYFELQPALSIFHKCTYIMQPKPKYVCRSSRSKTKQAPKPFPSKSVKATAKVAKFGKKKQPALGLETLTEVALTDDEQLKLATERSLIQTHSSHASRSGPHKETGVKPGVPDVPTYLSDEEEISWNERTDLDNDGDDFVHPKFLTHDDEARKAEEVNEEESFDPIVQTPSQVENTNDEDNDDDSHGMNVEGDKLDDEGANKEDDDNELYRDVNINLEGRDIQLAVVQTTQVIKDTHVTLTLVNLKGRQQSSSVSSRFVSNMLNPSPDTAIDSIFNLNIESTPQVDVLVTTTAEPPLLSAITLPPPSTLIIPHPQQTLVPTPSNALSFSLQDLPNFGSLFGFDHRLKTLESDRLRDEAQAENEDFLNKLNENNQKIIKEQVKEKVKAQVSKILPEIKKTINEQLEAEVLTRLSNSSKTSHAVAANLSELELKKILIDKMENDEDKDEEPSTGSNRGSKRRRDGKEQELTSAPKEKTSKTTGKSTKWSKSHHKSASESAQAEEPMHTTKDLEEPVHQEFGTGATEDQPVEEAPQHPNWFQTQAKPPTPNHTLTPELLAGPTYELMKGSCKSLVELEFFLKEVYKATTNQLDWNNPKGQQYPHDLRKPLPLIPTSRGKLTNLTVDERLAFNVSLGMFMRSIIIQWRMEDLQLGVKSYQKKINFTKPDTYRSDLKRKEVYTAYSNPRGFIYQNKDKQTRLMRIDELHKFSDGTLNDVRTALDDRLKGIRMQYLPQTI
nr:hypothetical protein [Tanacetum cinerariifolium]